MEQDFLDTLSQPNRQRVIVAQGVVAQKRLELGEHLRAACCYGSVAHQAAGAYSDVEMIIISDSYNAGVALLRSRPCAGPRDGRW